MSERSQAHAAQARADLERAVAALRDSDDWRCNLAVMARFHRYSFRNQLLIGLKMPDATYVRGFKSWIDASRCKPRHDVVDPGGQHCWPNSGPRF